MRPINSFVEPYPPPPHPLHVPKELWTQIVSRYAELHRSHHGLGHLRDVLRRFGHANQRHMFERPADAYFALLAHDAVYNPARTDNESQSATLARDWIRRFDLGNQLDEAHVCEIVELTARHGQLRPRDVRNRDAATCLDIDLSVLGSSWSRYLRFEREVAAEYVPIYGEASYRLGRRRFLRKLSARRWVFLTPEFHARYDLAARDNMQRYIELELSRSWSCDRQRAAR